MKAFHFYQCKCKHCPTFNHGSLNEGLDVDRVSRGSIWEEIEEYVFGYLIGIRNKFITPVYSGTLWFTLVHSGTLWYTLVQPSTLWYTLVQPSTLW